ncbi:MAG: Asp-tRNA(Asn)/Glu-tRNA(Gln) amidotransferase subunit GatB [Thermoproteota archaeon]|nr:Asp-tRNA(Asn)/Glu-tRNA(Gln) amidotransferase subunit GatB [Thermoproteota archaeon]MDQ3806550.1 Asp-tRNA(Asn)/Glu-tRNA(Gln) amidotransferase subunit GatB [Thermoproteota archaeon]
MTPTTTTTTTKIGLEIHCQLTGTKSKLFCKCSSDYRGKDPNSNICPICAGLPGTLPLLNQKTVEFAAMIALALGCKFPDEIAFYRKNYFYPDLPKNFQLTQYNAYGISSIGIDGKLQYSNGKDARIRRVQLEEDPGRLVYASGSIDSSVYVLIDYNRAGVPLVEIVTEPDFADTKDVRMFLDKITSIIEHLSVCDTKLEGSVRCDANVSIDGGNKVEIKNISSFGDVEKALRYEITRQRTMTSREIQVRSETRHWDDARKVTKESRTKEEEQDYRYFPEPDIPLVMLGSEFVSFIKQSMPELPDSRKERFMSKYGLSAHIAQVLIGNKELADFFESTLMIYLSPKEIANWLVTDLMSFIDERQKEEEHSLFAGLKVGPEHIADLARLVDQDMINRATAKQILGQIVRTGEMPSELAKREHASRIDDVNILAQAIQFVFQMEQAAVQDAKRNTNVANFLLGKVMKITKGKADPKVALEMIQKKLKEN